jgi:hypothetical protein
MVLLPRMHPATSHAYLRHLMEQSCTTSEHCGGEVVVAEGATEDQKQCEEGLAARPNPVGWRLSLSHIQPYFPCCGHFHLVFTLPNFSLFILLPASYIASYKLKA